MKKFNGNEKVAKKYNLKVHIQNLHKRWKNWILINMENFFNLKVHIKDVHEIKSVPKFMLQFNSKISKKEK